VKRALVTNRHSRANRRRPDAARALAATLGAELFEPKSIEALDAMAPDFGAAEELFVHGGDGTLHRVLTALHRGGIDLPTVSLLRAGTMNIVADSIGQKAAPERVAAMAASGGAPRVEVACPMAVDVGEEMPCVGFLAGGGVISRFLELYYQSHDPTPAGAARLLLRGSLSALVGGRLARRLTRPFDGELRVDEERWTGGPWTAVALGTVEELGLGFTPFPLVRQHRGHAHVIGIGTSISGLALELPRVFFGKGLRHPRNREQRARRVELVADEPIPFMVDGDFYAGAREVVVTVLAPMRFHVWTG